MQKELKAYEVVETTEVEEASLLVVCKLEVDVLHLISRDINERKRREGERERERERQDIRFPCS